MFLVFFDNLRLDVLINQVVIKKNECINIFPSVYFMYSFVWLERVIWYFIDFLLEYDDNNSKVQWCRMKGYLTFLPPTYTQKEIVVIKWSDNKWLFLIWQENNILFVWIVCLHFFYFFINGFHSAQLFAWGWGGYIGQNQQIKDDLTYKWFNNRKQFYWNTNFFKDEVKWRDSPSI